MLSSKIVTAVMTPERHDDDDKIIQKFIELISKQNLERKCHNLENIIKVCSSMKSIMGWNFNFENFYSNILEIPEIPLEILWNLHIFQIMPLEIYLLKMHSVQSVSHFSERLCHFCFQDCCSRWPILSAQTGLMSNIIERAFFDAKNDEMLELKQVSKAIVEKLLQYIFAFKDVDISAERLKAFFSLWACGTIDSDSLHLFSLYALQNFVNTLKASEIEAFISQDNWKNRANPFHFLTVIEKFIENLNQEEIRFILVRALWNDDTNWKNFSVIISALSQSTEDKSFLIKEIIATLLKDGFDQLNPKSFQRALLIGRLHSVVQQNASFAASYGAWYQTSIGGCLQGRSPQSVSLLIQVLSDMLPYEENIDCIKAFLERPLIVPPECQAMNLDYIVLLKTRVKDLQPQIDTEKVIEKVLHTFQETKKIPPYILEASLMNKHHYLNEFLPALLKPRVIPSVADTRERFIDFLNKSGKIPNCIYQKYKMSCQKEQQNLIAGINIDDNFEFLDDDIQIID